MVHGARGTHIGLGRVDEGDVDAVSADRPVERVCARLERSEERHAA